MPTIDLGKVVGPQGPQGVQGARGPQGATGAKGEKGDPGAKGDTGLAATVAVGTVRQLAPGSTPTVVMKQAAARPEAASRSGMR